MKRCTFIGHSILVKLNFDKLKSAIEEQIKNGAQEFLIGTYGEFDKLCFLTCLELKKTYDHIKIFKVFANISKMMKEEANRNYKVISYNIEHFHFKQRITKTNQSMIDSSDMLICYVDPCVTYGGAFAGFKYAKKKNKKIINLYWQIDIYDLK